ncbi:DNA glycosylase [Lasiosphaeria miniovina]|uniref:DNA-(apurinic or apyrimidinic site) lyase n=1 Tax=Lasiosphaeria miniovina TaxID=1954250 RepID=A0AA40AJF5_9PEZI|nr:DNA glycosylase [Lasiosphaeria miniovina]KAK0716968.1 DNA glycosylase [Lasiosphaeria miniovina]
MGGVQRAVSEWQKLPLSLTELCIDTTLRCGQSFRWRKIDDEWHCVLQGCIISLKQDAAHLHYRAIWPSHKQKLSAAVAPRTPLSLTYSCPSPRVKEEQDDGVQVASASVSAHDSDVDDDDGTARFLRSYFALSHSLSAMYEQWASSDANFARRAPAFTGIRILNQDAWETLVAFICSSNNNISRISQMVHKLCLHYGPYIGTVAGETFHDFPGPEALAGTRVEAHLRELGFGYRAKYIAETARIVATERPAGWLRQLRNPECPALDALGGGGVGDAKEEKNAEPTAPSYRATHEALVELSGVGPKVSDCVCLMGLGWGEAVPVDTHVWQIAQRDYAFGKGGKSKTFSKATYDAVGDHFRKIWGPHAGWAQSVLFTANLKSFSQQASGAKAEVSSAAIKVEEAKETTALAGKPAARVTKRKTVVTEVSSAVVKVEEITETTALVGKPAARVKKRKTVVAKVALKLEDDDIQVAEAKISTLRTSKRLRTRA